MAVYPPKDDRYSFALYKGFSPSERTRDASFPNLPLFTPLLAQEGPFPYHVVHAAERDESVWPCCREIVLQLLEEWREKKFLRMVEVAKHRLTLYIFDSTFFEETLPAILRGLESNTPLSKGEQEGVMNLVEALVSYIFFEADALKVEVKEKGYSWEAINQALTGIERRAPDTEGDAIDGCIDLFESAIRDEHALLLEVLMERLLDTKEFANFFCRGCQMASEMGSATTLSLFLDEDIRSEIPEEDLRTVVSTGLVHACDTGAFRCVKRFLSLPRGWMWQESVDTGFVEVVKRNDTLCFGEFQGVWKEGKISPRAVVEAVMSAAKRGFWQLLQKLLLDQRLTAEELGRALCLAAHAGKREAVILILEDSRKVSNESVMLAHSAAHRAMRGGLAREILTMEAGKPLISFRSQLELQREEGEKERHPLLDRYGVHSLPIIPRWSGKV